MSQNSVISIVLVILAILVGVYFFKGEEEATKVVNYEEAKTSKAEANSDETESSSSESRITPDVFVGNPGVEEPSSEESSSSTTMEEAPVETSTSTDNNTASTESTEPIDIVSADPKDVVEPVVETKANEYTIIVSGTVQSSDNGFKILAKTLDGDSAEFVQGQLADGVYQFSSDKAFVSVSIDIKGYAPVLIENISLVSNKATIQVNLEPLAALKGSVHSFQGNLVPGAVLNIQKLDFKKKAYANANGEFEFSDLAPGQYDIKVIHPNFIAKDLMYTVEKGEHKQIKINLDKLAVIGGTLVDNEGQNVVNVDIVLKGEKGQLVVKSGPLGDFNFDQVADGSYELIVQSKKGALNEKVALSKNLEIIRKFQLTPPPSISGIVVDGSGKPIEGVKLFTFDESDIIEDTTGADGKFNLFLAKPGKYRVLTSNKNLEMLDNNKLYSPSNEKVILQAQKRTFLKGKVYSATGQSLKDGFELSVVSKSIGQAIPLQIVQMEDDVFSVPLNTVKFLPKGDYQIKAVTKTGGVGHSISFVPSEISESKEVVVTLDSSY